MDTTSCVEHRVAFREIVIPFAYVLVDSKLEGVYEEIFETLLKDINIDGAKFQLPKIVSLDFEQGLINAVRSILKPMQLIGCFFHYSQALWRKANEMKLRKLPVKLLTIELITSMQFLCFVNKNEIHNLWLELKETYKGFPEFNEFMDYYEVNWLTMDRIEMWNYHDLIYKNELEMLQFEITNNYLESFNNQILIQNFNVILIYK